MKLNPLLAQSASGALSMADAQCIARRVYAGEDLPPGFSTGEGGFLFSRGGDLIGVDAGRARTLLARNAGPAYWGFLPSGGLTVPRGAGRGGGGDTPAETFGDNDVP